MAKMAAAPMLWRIAESHHPRKKISRLKNWTKYIASHMAKSKMLRLLSL
jgi:hypothetical protein